MLCNIMKAILNQAKVWFHCWLSYLFKIYSFFLKSCVLKDISIIHISPNYLVINKQFDITINSDCPERHPVTVAMQLNHKFPHLSDSSTFHGFRFCHRLDYSTSGILCVALTKNAARFGSLAFQLRRTEKYYLALVQGHIAGNYLKIDKAIGKDIRPMFSHCMCTSDKEYCKHPKWALTELLVLQRGIYDIYPATKVLFKLITGRRHQLRVHCHELGHTIIGDYTYSNRRDVMPYRMFLHSYRLVLPTKVENIDVCTEDPFTEFDHRNKWRPVETVTLVNQEVFNKFLHVKQGINFLESNIIRLNHAL